MQKKYESLIRSTRAYKALGEDVKKDKISHAYIFTGEDDVAFSVLTACLLSDCFKGLQGFEQKINARVHPDVFYLPQGEKEKVLVADIDFLVETAYFTPTESDKKFYVIEHAETMTESAQNKLLKILEEPPKCVHIVLQCSKTENMLPTVLSRCKRLEVERFSSSLMYEELQKYYPTDKRLELAVSAGRGSLEHSEKLLSSDNFLKLFNLVLESLCYMKKSPQILGFASKLLIFKDDLDEMLDFYQLLFRDILVIENGEISCKFAADELAGLKREFSDNAVLNIMECLNYARRRLRLNGNPTSIIDQLLFSILEVKAKCPR